jgi:hypothetical protein
LSSKWKFFSIWLSAFTSSSLTESKFSMQRSDDSTLLMIDLDLSVRHLLLMLVLEYWISKFSKFEFSNLSSSCIQKSSSESLFWFYVFSSILTSLIMWIFLFRDSYIQYWLSFS